MSDHKHLYALDGDKYVCECGESWAGGHEVALTACGVKSVREKDVVAKLPNGKLVLFRNAQHRYFRLNIGEGKAETRYSITTLLQRVGSKRKTDSLMKWAVEQTRQGLDPFETRDDAGARGNAVHDAAEALGEGVIPDLSEFPEEQRGYVQGLCRFFLDAQPEVRESEIIVQSDTYGFAGRTDFLGDFLQPVELWVSRWDSKAKKPIRWKREFPAGLYLADYKTGFIGETEELQLAGYEQGLFESGYPRPDRKLLVKLNDDGTYEVVESVRTPSDFAKVVALDAMLRVPGRLVVEPPEDIRAAEKAAA